MGVVKVSVEAYQGRLRLRWRVSGKRYCLSLGLQDSAIARTVAEGKARQIEGDIMTGNFDPSLRKYKPASQKTEKLTLAELYKQFVKFKRSGDLERTTLHKYEALFAKIEYFENRPADSITVDDVQQFRLFLSGQKLKASTIKTRISTLRAAYDWAIRYRMIELTDGNPFAEVRIKVAEQGMPDVFTLDERETIIKAFREHKRYATYADFVEVALVTGCRPGELKALRWLSVSADCTQITIWEAMDRWKKRKETKNNKVRTIYLNKRLQEVLSDRKKRMRPTPQPEDLVFTALRGNPVYDDYFRQIWRRVLEECGVRYRHPYMCRHTALSDLLDKGWSPTEVAQTGGNTAKIVLKHYAGNVRGRRPLPD